jgi:uncharacterized LabA/DUF88 family protein
MERLIAYIDGYNLYYSLRSKGWKRFYWLNIQSLAEQFLKPDQTLMMTKYFTTIVKQPEDKRRRQAVFIDALKTLPNFQIYYGQFLSETIVCRRCGHTYTTYHEKMTDVNISVELMADASSNNFDAALLISADSDLAGVAATVRNLFRPKRVIAVFPPGRTSFALKQASSGVLHIGHIELSKSIFPEQVAGSNGVILHRPARWR